MNKFLKKILIFIIPLIIIAVVLEFAIRRIPNDYAYKNDYLRENAKDIEVLFMGSSHAYYGINPKYIDVNSFNAAHVSQSLDYDYKILEKYDEEFDNLRVIAIPISYFSLFSILEDGSEFWRSKNYFLYYDLDISKDLKYRSEIFGESGFSNAIKLYNYYLRSKDAIACTDLGFGFRSSDLEQINLNETAITAAERHTQTERLDWQNSIETINRITDFAKVKGANVLLYTPPAYHTYVSNLNKEQLKITINTAMEIDIKHNNVVYLNLLEDSRFLKEDFYDADHLNGLGAEKLTKILYEEMLK